MTPASPAGTGDETRKLPASRGATEYETRIHRNRDGAGISAASLIAVYHASQGGVTWVLGEDGKRAAAIVPAETAEFVLANLPPRHGRE